MNDLPLHELAKRVWNKKPAARPTQVVVGNLTGFHVCWFCKEELYAGHGWNLVDDTILPAVEALIQAKCWTMLPDYLWRIDSAGLYMVCDEASDFSKIGRAKTLTEALLLAVEKL